MPIFLDVRILRTNFGQRQSLARQLTADGGQKRTLVTGRIRLL